jgi:hypothetical protein
VRGENMETRKIIDVPNMNEAFKLLQNNVGKEYRIDCRALNPMEKYEFTINRGTITSVEERLNTIFVTLDNGGFPETFSASRMKEVKINENVIQFIYMDNSYFKIYVEEKGKENVK